MTEEGRKSNPEFDGSLRRLKQILAKKPRPLAAHAHSSDHRKEVLRSEVCGCFYCLEIFRPARILDWVDEDIEGIGKTALCPECGIDSVIGSASGYPISKDFLRSMHDHWF
jgi:hypothetical protein